MLINIIVAVVIGGLGVALGVSGGFFAVMILIGVFIIGPFINFIIKGDQ